MNAKQFIFLMLCLCVFCFVFQKPLEWTAVQISQAPEIYDYKTTVIVAKVPWMHIGMMFRDDLKLEMPDEARNDRYAIVFILSVILSVLFHLFLIFILSGIFFNLWKKFGKEPIDYVI